MFTLKECVKLKHIKHWKPCRQQSSTEEWEESRDIGRESLSCEMVKRSVW